VEGLVADDGLRHLYVGEEDVGIWKYSAEPNGGSARTQVDRTGTGGQLAADVEGQTNYYASGGAGYLLASSQGNNEFAVYRRDANNAFVGSFGLIAGGGIDAVTDTDGIDVTNFPLGSQFPQGLFIAQDNDDNFKLARWDAIDAAFGGALISDTAWDPRLVGRSPRPPALPGDYNSNGQVDAADYVVWRKTLGQSVNPYSGADGSGNGRVDALDYSVWRGNSNQILASAALGDAYVVQAAESAAALVDESFSFAVKTSTAFQDAAGSRADFGIAKADTGHKSELLLLAHFQQPSDPPAGTHPLFAERHVASDFQPKPSETDSAFESQFFATDQRTSALELRVL
jgi:hypothetical protein